MAKKSAASTAWKVFVGVLVAALLLIIVAEFGLRWFMTDRIGKEFRETTAAQGIASEEDPHVSFGSLPVLVGLLRGSLGEVNIDTPSTLQVNENQVTGQPPLDIHLEDMTTDQDDPVAGALNATTTVPDDFLRATFQNAISEQSGIEQLGDVAISDVTANEAAGTLNVEAAGGLFTLSVRPHAEDGHLKAEATDAKLFGIGLPDSARRGIEQAIQDNLTDQFLGDLRVDDVEVTNGELRVSVSGTDVHLKQLSEDLGESDPNAGARAAS